MVGFVTGPAFAAVGDPSEEPLTVYFELSDRRLQLAGARR
jgi:hypothetical protein